MPLVKLVVWVLEEAVASCRFRRLISQLIERERWQRSRPSSHATTVVNIQQQYVRQQSRARSITQALDHGLQVEHGEGLLVNKHLVTIPRDHA